MILIHRNGVYPYEFIDDPSKLYYVGLPPPKSIQLKSNMSGISDIEDKHAKHAYSTFKCKTFRDDHEL